VQVLDPPPLLRPETLCRARFLLAANAAATAMRAFLVPRQALQDGVVFRFDPAARCARAVAVTVVQETADGVLVQGDLSVTQRVILSPVHDGKAVQERLP
jgi:hypothetical protein